MKESDQHWTSYKREKEASRSEISQALTSLGGVVPASGHLRCPFHDDKHPSATLKQSDGKWFFSCHAASCNVCYDVWDLEGLLEGKDAQTILKETKKRVLDEYDRKHGNANAGRGNDRHAAGPAGRGDGPSRTPKGFDTAEQCVDWVVAKRRAQGEDLDVERFHPYTDPDTGEVRVHVVRLRNAATGKKSYTQVFLDRETGRWSPKKPKDLDPTPLYNRIRIRDAKNILMVEGEACVEAFTRLGMEGWAATTTLGGAGKAAAADLTPLAGKTVYLWADNDDYDEKLKRFPGEHHMQEIADRLLKLSPAVTIRRVRYEELDLLAKGDIVDYLEQFGTAEEKIAALKLVFQDAESVGSVKGLREQLEAIAAGTYEHIPFPDAECLSELSKAGLPGTVTLVCGDPGVAKSFWALEKSWKWHRQGRKVRVLMLEEDFVYWQRRAMAQMAGVADAADVDWIKGHPKRAMEIFAEVEPMLESFSRRIDIAPSRPTMQWCADWVDRAVDEGNDWIVIDPITAAASSDKTWLDDHEFLFSVKESIVRGGSRLLLTTHPKLDVKSKPSLAAMAGGAAWPRFSQTVLWLRLLDKAQKSAVDPGGGELIDVHHEREIQIRKARNGRGAGSNIATILDRSTLCFVECGEIVDLDQNS
ncbi:MAG: AAA family ATPase [Pyrinomonadaceae bacterium]